MSLLRRRRRPNPLATASMALTPLLALLVFAAQSGPKAQGANDDCDNIAHTLSPLPSVPPPDTTNEFGDNPRAAALGQMLFFEKGIAGPILVGTDRAVDLSGNPIPANRTALGRFGETGKIACASCHQPESGWMFDVRSDDGVRSNPHATALGANWTTRNASSIINTAYYHI